MHVVRKAFKVTESDCAGQSMRHAVAKFKISMRDNRLCMMEIMNYT